MATTTARIKDLDIAPRKVGVVASLIRGRTIEDAMTILQHTPRKSSEALYKLLSSARANAENNHNMKPNNLIIKEITVGPGTVLKRFIPASRGRALPIQKRRTNVFLVVEGEERKKTEAKEDSKSTKTSSSKSKTSTKTSVKKISSREVKKDAKTNAKKEKK